MKLQHLSHDLYLYLATFLEENEKILFGSCCLSFYKDLLIKHFRVLKIDCSKSNFLQRYQDDESFCERFAKYLPYPEHQLHINLSEERFISPEERSVPHEIPFSRIYFLSLSYDSFRNYFMDRIEKIHHLGLFIDFEDDVITSENVLLKDYGIRRLKMFNMNWENESLLILPSSLEYLELDGWFDLLPLKHFSNLKELSLRDQAVSDVSILAHIPKLTLDWCHEIVDITPLQTTRDITIIQCKGIVDYRNALTYSRRIKIVLNKNVNAIIDVTCFKAVQNLTVEDLSGTKNIIPEVLPKALKRLGIRNFEVSTNFDHLYELAMSKCWVKDVHCLGQIPILSLSEMNLQSLEGLGFDEDLSKQLRNRQVTVVGLDQVNDYSPLNTIHTVVIVKWKGFINVNQVKDVKDLSISIYSDLPNCQLSTPIMSEKFTFSGIFDDSIFPYLQNVQELCLSEISNYDQVNWTGLMMLTNLRRLVISDQYDIKRMDGAKMKILKILEDHGFRFYSDKTSLTYIRD